jgi:membrane protease YdiL (CAAX protease family)
MNREEKGMTFLPDNWRYRLKQLAWAGAFLVVLAGALLPVIFLSASYDHVISIYEQAALIGFATALIQLFRRRSLWEVTGRPGPHWLRQLAFGCLLGALLMLAPALLLWATGFVRFHGAGTGAEALAGAMLLMAAVAVAEELLFRGLLFQRLVDALGAWPAQAIIGVLFVLTHLANPGMTGATKLWAGANIFVASFLFGMAYLRTRSLAMPLGIHFMANTTQGILLGFGVSGESEPRILEPLISGAPAWLAGGPFGLEASLPGLISVAVLLFLLGIKRGSEDRP